MIRSTQGQLYGKRICSGCFFFSSRRRHTRSLRDWSSDVCSSDLLDEMQERYHVDPERILLTGLSDGGSFSYEVGFAWPERFSRSEERRVGKECRCWGSPYH